MIPFRKLATVTCAAVAAAGGMVLVTPAAAQAARCSMNTSGYGSMGGWVEVSCTDVNASAIAMCTENDSEDSYFAEGPWVGPGQTSRAQCHEYAYLSWAYRQID